MDFMLNKKIKIVRVSKDMTQVALARATGLSPARISRIERGVYPPYDYEIAKIKLALGYENLDQ